MYDGSDLSTSLPTLIRLFVSSHPTDCSVVSHCTFDLPFSILKEISPGISLEGMMLKLKLQYFGHLMRRADSLEKTLDAGRDWGQEEKGTPEDEMAGWHH